MQTFTLTVSQLKEIFEAGANTEEQAFRFEKLALIIQDHVNNNVSVHNPEYKHMHDIIELLEI
jgi:hypothetical protein